MKSLLIFAVVLGVACGQFQGQFQSQFKRPSSFGFASTPKPVYRPSAAAVPRSSGPDAAAETVRSGTDIQPDGAYNYFYDTNNGIAVQEEGTPKQFPGNPPVAPVVVRGTYSYTAPGGEVVTITYTADENGYQASGPFIPTPPPVPEAILRSIEYNLRNAKPSRR